LRNMILPILRNEIAKTVRTKIPYLGIVAVCLVCVVIFIFTRSLTDSDTVNGWAFVGFAMQGAFSDVGLVFIAIFAALLLAEETGSGTARMVMSSPVWRWEFFVAKTLMGLLYVSAMYATGLIVAVVLGAFRYEFGDVADTAGLIYAKKEVFLNLVAASFLGWIPISAIVPFGVLLSAMTKKGSQATGIVVGVLVLVETVKHLLGIGSYVFTTYIGSSWAIFQEVARGVAYEWFPETWKILVVPLIYWAILFTAGLVIFCKRDLND
jgi:ABC-type transport system involved in multi-copper enzyme maturation permease subunit